MSDVPSGGHASDVERLHQLGYAQELRRGMRTFSNFAVSFTIISILSGCLTLFGFGMNTGGPAVMTIGWLVVGFFVTLVALGMAEVASSYPTAGGLYYWSAKLAKSNAPAWSWFTGWFNLLGQVAVTAGIDFGLAFFINAFLNIAFGVPTDPPVTIAIYAVVLFLHGLLNTFGIRLVALLNDVSVWWHIVVVAIIFVAMFFLAPAHTDLGAVFTTFVNNTSKDPAVAALPALYVVLIGLLNAQYTLTGYDASAHMSEETHNAAESAPRGIVWSVVVSVIFGFILLVAMNYGIDPNGGYERALGALVPPAQIFIDAVGQAGGLLILLGVIGAQFFCGMASVTANSRMIYAFARDRAIPGHELWHSINPRTRTPTNSIWLAAIGAFILGLPYLFNAVAYAAVTSIAVIGLYIAYIIPVFLRVRAGDSFQRGPWHLGSWSRLIGTVATIWVVFIAILFMLPQATPIRLDTFNYAPIAVGVVVLFAGGWWVLSAHKWFKGPKVQGSPEELAAIERDLELQAT
ncbi:MAG TPA: amino acid permease [Candidatus Limnocylindrales bacterium]|nr:amino acid permease [Candidatus Limnocylindrales bacterium]